MIGFNSDAVTLVSRLTRCDGNIMIIPGYMGDERVGSVKLEYWELSTLAVMS